MLSGVKYAGAPAEPAGRRRSWNGRKMNTFDVLLGKTRGGGGGEAYKSKKKRKKYEEKGKVMAAAAITAAEGNSRRTRR